MKKLITLTAIFLCSFSVLFAETPENRKENPHEIRIGIADSYMEASFEKPHNIPCNPPLYGEGPLNHTGHMFVEYQYRVNSWFSAGVNVDCLYSWYYIYPGPMKDILGQNFDRGLYSSLRFSAIPTLRFTYFHNELVDLYSAFGVGFNYSYFIEDAKNYAYSESRTLGAAFDLCALGISIGKKHWFGAFELGGTTAFGYEINNNKSYKPSLEMPIPLARLLRISVGYRF